MPQKFKDFPKFPVLPKILFVQVSRILLTLLPNFLQPGHEEGGWKVNGRLFANQRVKGNYL
jgi:hypothetical protein